MNNFIRISATRSGITTQGQYIDLPQPRRGLNMVVSTMVDTARNSNAVLVGQKVGRDQQKLDNLYWAYLDADTWQNILDMFDRNFYVYVRYPNMVKGGWTVRKMYPGDRTATPYWLDKSSGEPTHYIDCKVNLIDVGE